MCNTYIYFHMSQTDRQSALVISYNSNIFNAPNQRWFNWRCLLFRVDLITLDGLICGLHSGKGRRSARNKGMTFDTVPCWLPTGGCRWSEEASIPSTADGSASTITWPGSASRRFLTPHSLAADASSALLCSNSEESFWVHRFLAALPPTAACLFHYNV